MKFESVPVNMIDVGDRRRAEFGDMEGLAAGIRRVGLLSPILVDRNGNGRFRLIFGERRLVAVKMLGWERIPAQLREHLSEEEFRDIEIEENENRKALTEGEKARTFASSKRLVEKAKKAAAVSPQSAGKPGRPSRYGKPKPELARDLAVSEDTIERAEKHVETVEQYPFMQGNTWRQSHVLAMRESLENLPEPERDKAISVLSRAKVIDPGTAVRMINNFANKTPTARDEIYRLSRSDDSRDVSLALTKCAELPPRPDPRLELLETAIAALGAATDPFPNDPLTPNLLILRNELKTIRKAIRNLSKQAIQETVQ